MKHGESLKNKYDVCKYRKIENGFRIRIGEYRFTYQLVKSKRKIKALDIYRK